MFQVVNYCWISSFLESWKTSKHRHFIKNSEREKRKSQKKIQTHFQTQIRSIMRWEISSTLKSKYFHNQKFLTQSWKRLVSLSLSRQFSPFLSIVLRSQRTRRICSILPCCPSKHSSEIGKYNFKQTSMRYRCVGSRNPSKVFRWRITN